jgi:hypothetical protein
MPRETLNDCRFVVGAGVSLASGLPGGGDFSRRVFDLLVRTGPTTLASRTLARLRDIVTERLRLEIFLEIRSLSYRQLYVN